MQISSRLNHNFFTPTCCGVGKLPSLTLSNSRSMTVLHPNIPATPPPRHMDDFLQAAQNIEPIKNLHCCTKEQLSENTRQYTAANCSSNLTQRMIDLLQQCSGKQFNLGMGLDLYHHNLQTATFAYKDNADDDLIVAALLHDVGELLSPLNHGDIAASILKPYINKKAYWILKNHELFQAYVYLNEPNIGFGKEICKDAYYGHEYFDDAVNFCEKYDSPAFNPNEEIMDIDFFKPLLIDVFSRVPYQNDTMNPKAKLLSGYYNDL